MVGKYVRACWYNASVCNRYLVGPADAMDLRLRIVGVSDRFAKSASETPPATVGLLPSITHNVFTGTKSANGLLLILWFVPSKAPSEASAPDPIASTDAAVMPKLQCLLVTATGSEAPAISLVSGSEPTCCAEQSGVAM